MSRISSRPARRRVRSSGWAIALSFVAAAAVAQRPHPILFATQVPLPYDFTAIGSVFGNHEGGLQEVGRGGDLYLLYPDNSLRNLTFEAGYGHPDLSVPGSPVGFQGSTSIAVREPCVHWSGTRALFSMVIGAPKWNQRYQVADYFWQIYEVTGLGQGQTATITKVPRQPLGVNNVSPCYSSDDKILFTTDRSFNGAGHLYPQLDEYEEAETVSGLWRLDPATGRLTLLDHAPSGDFTPVVDSFGRVVFTRWDHLQRDQQADSDYFDEQNGQPPTYGTFNWSSEAPGAVPLATRAEVFPEPRAVRTDLLLPHEQGHSFNHFFPWTVNQDGTELETLVHVGRHELHTYFDRAFNNDSNLDEFICGGNSCGRTNGQDLLNLLHVRERPNGPAGVYVGVDAPEFYTHSAGQVLSMPAAPGTPADDLVVTFLTHRDTKNFDDTPGPCHSGLYRNPLPLSNGATVAVHAGERQPGVPETRQAANEGTRNNPIARYKFRMRSLVPAAAPCAGFQKYGAALTPGIQRTLSWWDPDELVQHANVTMWELYPVEVRSRPVPPRPTVPIETVERNVFTAAGVALEGFRTWLRNQGLALVVSRNITRRALGDVQQPWRLRVRGPGGAVTAPGSGILYDVDFFQFYQGDLIRGLGGADSPRPGRRVLAQTMHSVPAGYNPPAPGGPPGSVRIADDGSMAALLPAHRAMAWHMTESDASPAVRERYWVSFQPGEVRTCKNCHGLNSVDQAGNPPPTNSPQALALLLQHWQASVPWIFGDGFESGDTTAWAP